MWRLVYILLLVGVILLMLSLVALAQQVMVTPGDRFAWPMVGAPGLEALKTYRYEVEVDGSIRREALTEVSCEVTLVSTDDGKILRASGTAYECSAVYPTMSLGGHKIRVRAVDISVPGIAVEGAWSSPIVIVMTPMRPPVPGAIRVIKPTTR